MTSGKAEVAVKRRPGKPKGTIDSEATRQKKSVARLGRKFGPMSEQGRKNIGVAHKGKHHSSETRALFSAIRTGKKLAPPTEQARHNRSEAQRRRWANYDAAEKARLVQNLIDAPLFKHDNRLTRFVAQKLEQYDILFEREKRISSRFYVDFFLPVQNTILEVNGCYWHGCEQCGYNEPMHLAKRVKDAKRYAAMRAKGFTVSFLWEHDILPHLGEVPRIRDRK